MITEYPIEDLIIISGAREQKKRKPAYSKGNVGASKNAGQAFSMPRLSSQSTLYTIAVFRLFRFTNQDSFSLILEGQ